MLSPPNSTVQRSFARLVVGRYLRPRVLAAITGLVALTATLGLTQQSERPQGEGQPRSDSTLVPGGNRPLDPNDQMQMQQKQAKNAKFEAANSVRRKQIADDAARLLQLATELKSEVDKTDKDTLSLQVIRKAESIEKLAKGVKEKMKLTVGAS